MPHTLQMKQKVHWTCYWKENNFWLGLPSQFLHKQFQFLFQGQFLVAFYSLHKEKREQCQAKLLIHKIFLHRSKWTSCWKHLLWLGGIGQTGGAWSVQDTWQAYWHTKQQQQKIMTKGLKKYCFGNNTVWEWKHFQVYSNSKKKNLIINKTLQ